MEIVDSRLKNSDETFSCRKQCNYENLLEHNRERWLSKREEFCRDFGPLGRKFCFFAGSQQM